MIASASKIMLRLLSLRLENTFEGKTQFGFRKKMWNRRSNRSNENDV